ncbi:MAG TPA: tubulin-like doman-containing protein, partial [Myxococcota bacterium]
MTLTFNDRGLATQTDQYDARVEKYAQDADRHGTYPPTILVGLGGTGAKVLQHIRRLTLERFGSVDALEGVAYLSLDTDVASRDVSAELVGRDPFATEIAFKEHERLNLKVAFREYLGPNLVNHPHLKEWWDSSLTIADDFNLEQGAGQIRPLSRLVFFGSRQRIIDKLDAQLQTVKSQANTSPRLDQSAKTRIVVVAGLAGGTGSGLFLDFAALARQLVRDANIEGCFVLPGVYRAAEGAFAKIAANGYAALRELNHYQRHPFKVRWNAREREISERGLYDRAVIFSGVNHANQNLKDTSDAYGLIGEQLFIDFSEGGMARWVQGVRINRAQYLMRSVDREYRIQMPDGTIVTSHAESWKTAFQTFGISKIVFPSWRLLSYASYELASQMMGLMDPGRGGRINESITELRDDFAFQAGFFQGERADEEGGRKAFHLVVDKLRALRGARTQAANFDDHLDTLAQEMVDESAGMFENATSREDLNRRFREVQSLLGDPWSATGGGDWATLIRENKRAFVKDVVDKLPDVVEHFRSKPQVGPSGVAQLLAEVLSQLDKPADRAWYLEWFKQKKVEKAEQKNAAYAKWTKHVDHAVEAGSGFFKSAGNHREAVKMAGDAFRAYWKAAVHEYVADQAIEAMIELKRVLNDQADRLRRICESMFEMRAVFEGYRDFFGKPNKTTAIQELDVPSHLQGQLLGHYLGYLDDEKEARLTALMARGLREMKLTTLSDLEDMLRKKPDVFRARLFRLCFLALKGDNGTTNAFRRSEDEDYVREGFINRYSAIKMLAEQAGDEKKFKEIVDRLYTQGLPWVRPRGLTGMGLSEADIPKDCFVGFSDEGNERFGQRLLKVLEGRSGDGFRARRVKVNDPSEIIFYTESAAFPAAYVSELYDDNGLQRYYEDAVRSGTALHIHQDFHQFQDLLPLKDGAVRQLKQAWKLFILGTMLGRIRTDQPSADDERRFTWVYRRQVSSFEQRWESLGPEMAAINRLADDGQLLTTLSRDVEEARNELERRGLWGEALFLADYVFHCVYPVHKDRALSSGQGAEIVGSVENEAVNEIRSELRERARARSGLDANQLAERVAVAA